MIQEQLDVINRSIRTSMCEHENIEYEYDYEDGFAFVEAARCEDCGKDVFQELSEHDIDAINMDAAERLISDRIDSAVDNERGK